MNKSSTLSPYYVSMYLYFFSFATSLLHYFFIATKQVSFGWGHALALTKDGKLFGWGYAADGRLGQMEQKLDSPQTQPLEFDKSLESLTPMLDVVEKLVAEKIEKEKNMPIIWEPCEVLEVSCLNVSDMACGLDHSLVLCSESLLFC